jgi:molybdate transport system substrate-binding protein
LLDQKAAALFLRRFLAILVAFGLNPAANAQQRGPVVLAASSLQEALNEAADRWAAKKHARPVLSFAGTPTLARQIEAGAPADIFISADEAWMRHVAAKRLIRPETRVTFLANTLVLIAPLASKTTLTIQPGAPLVRALGSGRMAMANPASVPAGRYGKAALESLGVWRSVQSKVALTENVRSALALVERGEAPLGIVYATDARASRRVKIVGVFPTESHPQIAYAMATPRTSTHKEAEGFRRFLLSREAIAIFIRRGFTAGQAGLN